MEAISTCLVSKSCVPCHGGVPPLTDEERRNLLKELEEEWALNEMGHLYKEYPFENFMYSMDFANQIAEVAEKEVHHPDLKIAWGTCSVEIWTHKINGLTESDFILAAKIEAIYGKR